jgi:hypothetical protein
MALLAACGAPTQQAERAPTATAIPPNPTAQPTPTQQPTMQPAPTVQPTPTISQNVPQGYLAIGRDSVQFLQWHENEGGSFTGRAQAVHTSGQNMLEVKPETGELQGTRNGENVDLTLWGRSYLGTIAGDTLTLVVPTNTGELQTIEYHRASVEEYNEAARSFRQAIQQQAAMLEAQRAEAKATAAAQQAKEQAQRAWQTAYQDANAAMDGLAVVPRKDWFTDRDDGQTAVLVRDIQTMLRDTKATLANEDCTYNLQWHVDNIQYQADQLQYIRDNFDYTIGNLNEAITRMQTQQDVLGTAATDYIVNETRRLAEAARQQIDLVNEKYDEGKQKVQGIVEEAESVQCEQK